MVLRAGDRRQVQQRGCTPGDTAESIQDSETGLDEAAVKRLELCRVLVRSFRKFGRAFPGSWRGRQDACPADTASEAALMSRNRVPQESATIFTKRNTQNTLQIAEWLTNRPSALSWPLIPTPIAKELQRMMKPGQ